MSFGSGSSFGFVSGGDGEQGAGTAATSGHRRLGSGGLRPRQRRRRKIRRYDENGDQLEEPHYRDDGSHNDNNGRRTHHTNFYDEDDDSDSLYPGLGGDCSTTPFSHHAAASGAALLMAEFGHGAGAYVAARSYHPFLRALRVASRLRGVAFAAVWLAVVLIEGFVALLAKGGVLVVEVVCAVLDWVGADY